jgi:hypothetical protein
MKDMTTVLSLFEHAASKHAEAAEEGNYKTANKCYATLSKAVTLLKQEDKISALLEFLNHQSVGVRMWAARYLLPISENDAVQTLNQIASQGGIHSFTARVTLEEWHKGHLKP